MPGAYLGVGAPVQIADSALPYTWGASASLHVVMQHVMIDTVRRKSVATRLRCSLRYAPAAGAFPTVVGWPFAWMEVSPDSLTFSTGRLVPFSRTRWTVRRDEITQIDRTQHGLRFYAKTFSDPWVVASLAARRFLRSLAELGIEGEGPIQPSTWTTM